MKGKVWNEKGDTVQMGAGRDNAEPQCGRIEEKQQRTKTSVTKLAVN